MNATYLTKDQNWQDETTIYWFDVNGETYGVTECCGESSVIDEDGYSVNIADAKNYHLRGIEECVNDEMRAE